MPLLHEVAIKEYVVVHFDWIIKDVLAYTAKLHPSHIIARHPSENLHYLFQSDHLRALLLGYKESQLSIESVLGFSNRSPTPLADAYQTTDTVSDFCIVTDNNFIVGVYDTKSRAYRGGYRESRDSRLPAISLRLELWKRIVRDTPFSLIASIIVSENTKANAAVVVDAPNPFEIVLLPHDNVHLLGSQQYAITPAAQELTPVQFKLRATQTGIVKLEVFVFQAGQYIARGVASSLVVPNDAAAYSSDSNYFAERIAISTPEQPDLSLLIFERRLDSSQHELTYRLDSTKFNLNFADFGTKIVYRPDAIVQDLFRDINVQTHDIQDHASIHLEAKGAHLYKSLLPVYLQKIFWDHRHQISIFIIQSQEPWIPWELCRIFGRGNMHTEEGAFFCEAFAVTRWMLNISRKRTITLNSMALVAPQDSGLVYAEAEKQFLLSLASARRKTRLVPAKLAPLIAALSSGEFDCWHFVGHGIFQESEPNLSEFRLEGGGVLRPENLSGKVENLGIPSPLVFLNSCQVGRGAFSMTGIGGWARHFLNAGASAFIGAYWNINDETAGEFAKRFYTNLIQGQSIGEAVRMARISIRNFSRDNKEFDVTTWLAYTVFADPLALYKDANQENINS